MINIFECFQFTWHDVCSTNSVTATCSSGRYVCSRYAHHWHLFRHSILDFVPITHSIVRAAILGQYRWIRHHKMPYTLRLVTRWLNYTHTNTHTHLFYVLLTNILYNIYYDKCKNIYYILQTEKNSFKQKRN